MLTSMVALFVLLLLNKVNYSSLTEKRDLSQMDKNIIYEPNWNSLDKRPHPKWYNEAKVGIFIHWGVYSVPSFGSEWFWNQWAGNVSSYVKYMDTNYKQGFTYQEFAKDFNAEFFDPDEWADLFRKSGARYVVLTSKHHEGFALWPSKYSSNWNAKDIGPHRDIVGDLSKAVRKRNLTFGLYYSLFEWFNPLYLEDKKSLYRTRTFIENKLLPEMKDAIINYEPWILWSDGSKVANDTYWGSTEFLAWLYNESPVKENIVVNDRWGYGISCKHGDFFTCKDRYNPGVLQNHKWENAMTIDKKSWGFRRNAKLTDILTVHDLIVAITETVSCGGNILINIGPTKDGIIVPIFQERLLDLGKWLDINGEAIYGSTPWEAQNDIVTPYVWYTSKHQAVYAIVLNWPKSNTLILKSPVKLFLDSETVVLLLGQFGDVKWKLINKTIELQFPDKATVSGDWAWVLKITNKN